MKFLIGFVCGALTSALFLLWFLKSDSQGPVAEGNNQTIETAVNSDFEAFYERFHSDSAFQMEHIIFPLEGLPANADSATFAKGDFRWDRHNWLLHRKFDLASGEFKLEQSQIDEGMVIEQIKDKSEQYGIQRRFAKMGEEWFLIYYAGMNRLGPE